MKHIHFDIETDGFYGGMPKNKADKFVCTLH